MNGPRAAALLPILSLAFLTMLSCAPAARVRMGTISNLSIVDEEHPTMCEHRVPAKVCARCHPELAARFKAVDDWCPQHEVPESQCLVCHPELTFTPLPTLPPGADFALLSRAGEDVASLERSAVAGKVTIFDFYAEWCLPCREVDRHVYTLLRSRPDIAYRKLNIVDWETPIVKHYLANVPKLPYVAVYGKDGRSVGNVPGLDLTTLDQLLAQASQ